MFQVFHGADMDIVWMQRDFGLYVVNLFDTFHAAKLLEFPHLSLSYLLKHYINLEAAKHFQLADWRIRPLTDELLKYAREDTHYLIFIYIQMKNDLIAKGNKEKNLLRAVFDRSKTVCLKVSLFILIFEKFEPNCLQLCGQTYIESLESDDYVFRYDDYVFFEIIKWNYLLNRDTKNHFSIAKAIVYY